MEQIQKVTFTWVSEAGYRDAIGTLTGKFLNSGPEYWFEGYAVDPNNGNQHFIYGIFVKDIGIELFDASKDHSSTFRFIAVKSIGEENYHGQFYQTRSIDEIDGIDLGLSRMEVEEISIDKQSVSSTDDDLDEYELEKSNLLNIVSNSIHNHLNIRQAALFLKVKSDYYSRKLSLARLYVQENTSKKMKL